MNIQHIARPLAIKSLCGDGNFVGYASVFDVVDSQNEAVAAGAFRRSIAGMESKGRVPSMLWMHDPTVPIGIWLCLREDQNGLLVEGKLALGTQKGKEAYELLKMGALTGLSIGYRVVRSEIDKKRHARILTDVELFEISLVTFPANDKARVHTVKSPCTRGDRKQLRNPQKTNVRKAEDAVTAAAVARLKKAARVLKQSS